MQILTFLEKAILSFSERVPLEYYNPKIIKSGIDSFENEKDYIDTSSIEGVNNIIGREAITIKKRPSRANMQPVVDSVWFAKMKDSYKILILTEGDYDLINKIILSTGFQGIKADKSLPLSLLVALIITNDFKHQRDLNSVGTTMAGINNETLMKIEVPKLNEEDIKSFDEKYGYLVNQLSKIRREITLLKKQKKLLLDKYF